MLVTYLKTASGKRFGCIVAIGAGQIGLSFCNPKDEFNKDLARNIAEGRARKGSSQWDQVPNFRADFGNGIRDSHSYVESEIDKMLERSERYFKGSVV